jgi:hypothetical protein
MASFYCWPLYMRAFPPNRRIAASAEAKGPFLLIFRIYLLWLTISFYIICCRTFYGLKLSRGIFILTPTGSRAGSWGIKYRTPALIIELLHKML